MRLHPLTISGALLTLIAGCGDSELQKVTELQEYRVLAIRSDIPEPSPDETVLLSAIDHDPHAVDPMAPTGAPFYVWEICAFSVGALAQYDCLDPLARLGDGAMTDPTPQQAEVAARVIAILTENGVTPAEAATIFSPRVVQTEASELVLDLSTIGGVGVRVLYELCGALSADGLCRTLDGKAFTLDEGWNLYIKLYSGLEGVIRQDTVKLLKVREFEGRNRNNPAFAGLEATDGDGRVVTQGRPGQALKLTLTLVAGSAETYEELQYDDQGKLRLDGEGEPVTAEATEALLFSWYTTGGDFKRARTVIDSDFDQRENTLTLPEEPGPVRAWVVARDGRGGFAGRSLDLMVTEAP